jgi:beta-phosphoglucomutase-like phosphatase (HAD superfamily)
MPIEIETSLPTPSALIFDLDGTLVDTVGTRVVSWMDTFPEYGIQPDAEYLAPMMGYDGKRLARLVAEHYGVAIEPGVEIEIDIAAGTRFRELNARPRVLPAATEILLTLDERGTPWAIATSSLPEDARTSVASLRLPSTPVICDGADVEHAKPAPDLLLKAADLLGVRPEAVWYVGDSRWDMVAATAAAMTPIAVLTGATDEATLWEAGAAVVYPTLRELLSELS